MNTIKLTQTLGTIDTKTSNEEVGVTRKKLTPALVQSTKISARGFNKWKTDALIDHIINTHHQYTKESAVIIYNLAQKVAFHHSENHPELIKLTTTMFLFLHDLLNCMKKEEQMLFPGIKQLATNNSQSRKCGSETFGLKEWVGLMHKEHQASFKDLKLFHELTNGYKLPEDACNSYKCLFEKMKEFEDDLFLHLHLENNILFPKAIALDKELKKD